MPEGYIVTSHRSISLKKVSEDIRVVLEENGIRIQQILEYPTADPSIYKDIDFAIIVMTFDPAWIGPFAYLYRMLKRRGINVLFYTTTEGRLKRVIGDNWIYRDCEFIANSKYTRDKLIEAGARVIDVIYHGINVEEIRGFYWMRDMTREKLGFTDSDIVVGYIAGGYMRKGHELFNQVIKIVEKKDPTIKFVVLTDSKGAEKYNAGDNLILLTDFGKLSKDELFGLYHALDIYAQASLSEGFGLPVLEALAAGKLIVHADYKPLTEITNEETSIRVPVISRVYKQEIGAIEYELHYYNPERFAEAIIKAKELILDNREEIERRCIERAKMFDMRKTYKRFLRLITNEGR